MSLKEKFTNILDRYLENRGIKSPDELSQEEKATFEGWRKILSNDTLEIGDIKLFCQSQIDVIEGKWKDLNTEQNKKSEWIPYHTVYRTLLQVLDAPKQAREQLEAHLNQLIQ